VTRPKQARSSGSGWRLWGRFSWLDVALGLGFGTVTIALIVVLTTRGGGSSAEPGPLPSGAVVTNFVLPDAVTGNEVSSAAYVGKQPVVIVTLMGGFCRGCDDLLAQLAVDKDQFAARGAKLLIIDSENQPQARAMVQATNATSLGVMFEKDGPVVRQLGLWSNEMQMAWMGYVVTDKSGHVTAVNRSLSEALGAAPASVKEMLSALDMLGR
jgi:peroxiredoxin